MNRVNIVNIVNNKHSKHSKHSKHITGTRKLFQTVWKNYNNRKYLLCTLTSKWCFTRPSLVKLIFSFSFPQKEEKREKSEQKWRKINVGGGRFFVIIINLLVINLCSRFFTFLYYGILLPGKIIFMVRTCVQQRYKQARAALY